VQDLGVDVLDFSPERFERQVTLRRKIGRYFARLVDERRAEPRDDLLSALVAAEEAGSKLSFPELLSMLILLLVAGNETTTNLIGNAVLQLLAHPDALARLREAPERIPSAIEEVLRFDSPAQATVRQAKTATEVGGEKLDPGQITLLWIGSANRDEAAFDQPERFDIERDPNRHLAFGFGAHYCLGANLARLEARVALETLIERTRSFRHAGAGAAAIERTTSFILRGLKRLPVELEGR
jgi:cytochrome P450